MAAGSKKLSATFVSKVNKAGRYSDGDGLYLLVRSGSLSKSWSYVWIRNGKRREMGLGGVSTVSLKQARIAADIIRHQIGAGLDPRSERQKDKPKSFGDVADKVLGELQKTWKHPKHGAQWTRALTVLAGPLRTQPVNEINTQDVLRVVKPIWDKTPETGRRLRGRIERVLDYATAHGWRMGDNPARLNAHFKILLGSKKPNRKHYPAMPYAEVPAFMSRLQEKGTITALALEFTILTGSRTNETIGAVWDEVDMDAALWIIPAERMKAAREHKVPLSDRALEILKQLSDNRLSTYVFPGQKPRNPMSNMSMTQLMRRIGITGDVATTHGFRSSFRDWAGDKTNAPREVAEAAIAHQVGNVVEQSYRRGDALEKRRDLMRQWADYCSGKAPCKIVRNHAKN